MARKTKKEAAAESVATAAENEKLEHSEEGTSTTRDDRLDSGVPMLQGDPSEPVGPEDALGAGDKRGDYRSRVVGDHFESVAVDGGGAPVYADEKTGKIADGPGKDRVVVDRSPVSELVAQTPRTEQIGDVEGKKGGVETAAA